MLKNKELTVAQCWAVLGKDPVKVADVIKNSGETDKDIVEATEKAFENAKKIAKKLQSKFHPDKNQKDPKAAEKFNRVTIAIKCLEAHTIDFRTRYEDLKYRSHSSNKITIHFKDK